MTEKTDRKQWAGTATQEKTKMVAMRLPLGLIADLDGIAKRDKSTRAAVYREALRQFAATEKTPPKTPAASGLFE